MTLTRFENYRPEGHEWFKAIPTHWQSLPCRAIVNERSERNEDGQCSEYLSLMANIGIIPYADKGDIGNKKPEDLTKCKRVQVGDFVINSMNYYIGSYGVSRYAGICSPVYIVLTPKSEVVEPRFAFRIFEVNQFQEHAQSFGNGILEHRRSISWDILKAIKVPVPPLEEQRTIANFLDRETVKIDALVAEQRRLIELLKEKRQAVISHAVTKGLDPNAKMKPSGIEWLGDVPEHWRVAKCGYYLSILSGFAFPSASFSEDTNDTKLLRGINVGVGRLRWDETVYYRRSSGDGLDLYEMNSGDIVIGMDRPLISEGMRVAKVQPGDLPCLLLQRVASLKVGSCLDSDYLLYLLSSEMFPAHFAPETTGVSVPHISPDQIRSFHIPVPPLAEQRSIVTYVHHETGKFNVLICEAEHGIELLQERRTALISAAVTGKIDVRHLASQEAA